MYIGGKIWFIVLFHESKYKTFNFGVYAIKKKMLKQFYFLMTTGPCLASSLPFYLFTCTFYNRIVSRCFTESETQSRNPQVSTRAWKNSPLTGRNLEQDPAYEERGRETGQRK